MSVTREEMLQLVRNAHPDWMVTFRWPTASPVLSSWPVTEKVIHGIDNSEGYVHYAWGKEEVSMRRCCEVLEMCGAEEVKLRRSLLSRTDWADADE